MGFFNWAPMMPRGARVCVPSSHVEIPYGKGSTLALVSLELSKPPWFEPPWSEPPWFEPPWSEPPWFRQPV